MNARQTFEVASSTVLGVSPKLNLDKTKDYLLVSGLPLAGAYNPDKAVKSNIFAHVLTPSILIKNPAPANEADDESGTGGDLVLGDEANEILNGITHWIREHNSLDQRGLHGDKRYDYNISFYRRDKEDTSSIFLVKSFYLQDFIFDHNHPADATGIDDLMRMLDRDKLAAAMLDTLKEDFGINARKHAPLFWRRDIRECSHPDYRKPIDAAPVLVQA